MRPSWSGPCSHTPANSVRLTRSVGTLLPVWKLTDAPADTAQRESKSGSVVGSDGTPLSHSLACCSHPPGHSFLLSHQHQTSALCMHPVAACLVLQLLPTCVAWRWPLTQHSTCRAAWQQQPPPPRQQWEAQAQAQQQMPQAKQRHRGLTGSRAAGLRVTRSSMLLTCCW